MWAVERRDQRCIRGVEQGRAGLLPHRDQSRHPPLQGPRGRSQSAGQDPRLRLPEGHWQVDRQGWPRLRHPHHSHSRGRLRQVSSAQLTTTCNYLLSGWLGRWVIGFMPPINCN